jgi:hypothetical protein
MTPVTVSCTPEDAGWRCEVTIGGDPAATHHQVDVAAADLERLQPGASDPESLVHAAFDFLLAHEPRESILRRFELPVIGRYFPDWEAEVARRLPAD